MNDAERVERLLQMALSPVEPPERLTEAASSEACRS